MIQLAQTLRKAYTETIDALFPAFCIGCEREGQFFCAACIAELPLRRAHRCPLCNTRTKWGKTCNACAPKTELAGAVSFISYADTRIQSILHQWKYTPDASFGAVCARIITRAVCTDASMHGMFQDALICPIPLHAKKLKQRGFNQADALARATAAACGADLHMEALIRTKHTQQQATLDALDRMHNIQDAFMVSPSAYKLIQGKTVLVVDDVITSGGTASAAASALKNAGAREVWALTLAYGNAGG